jgi:hypothetical protein
MLRPGAIHVVQKLAISPAASSGSLQIQRLVAASIEGPDVIDGHFK